MIHVIQGQNDPRVPVEEARHIVTALKKRGIPVWYLLAKDEGHVWIKPSNWDSRSYAIALFVQEQLLK
jgi:dipeptidyl aminopeptidase/acylaminoacyl peptidase